MYRVTSTIISILIPALAIFFSAVGSAHPLSVSYSHFTKREGIYAVYRLLLDDMDLLLELDSNFDGTVSSAELQSARDRLQSYLRERVTVATNGSVLEPDLERISIWRDRSEFPYVSAGARYSTDWGHDRGSCARPDGSLSGSPQPCKLLARRPYRAVRFSTRQPLGRAFRKQQFVACGARIYVARYRTHFTGYDHLLFLLGLLVVGRGLRDLVAIVTSFTIAHSLTLALTTLGFLNPSVRVIEVAIALSIAYVGLENLIGRDFWRRWLIAFAFGLVHGFRFAAMLRGMRPADEELLIGLFTFNLGVELGQVTMVALAWPLLQKVRRTPYRIPVVRFVSAGTLGCGLFWFVQRVT